MAQLNRFIEVLHDQSADVLTLADGKPISISMGGKTTPVSRTNLTEPSLLGLLKEITPPELVSQIATRASLTFAYGAPSGAVTVEVRPEEAGLRVLLTRGQTVEPAGQASVTPLSAANGGPEVNTGPQAKLDGLLRKLVNAGGSDLHLRVGQHAVFRCEGRLARVGKTEYAPETIQVMLDSIMIEKDRERYAETGDVDFAYEIAGVARFRVNGARDRRGPMAVLRVIPTDIPTCDQLDITQDVRKLCYLTKGLVVVTGPTGSGKSTTLAALVDLMNREREDHILTIEDPIEFVHESKSCLVTHRQVGLHTESFKVGLRAALREDPDIILIGELRDLETVATAIETAETGHLVFGTLHTTTAASTIDRIIDQFPGDRQGQIRVMLSESLRGVIAQTLCRKIGGGRIAAREILLTTPALSHLIREGKTFQIPSIIQTNGKIGMVTLNGSLIDLVDRKLIEPKEAYLKSVDKSGMVSALQNRGHDCLFLKA